MDLMEHALELLQRRAFPAYKRNIDRRKPPLAHGEFGPSAAAALLLTSGLDYHLARVKWLCDIVVERPPLPHAPYFNWKIDYYLPDKIERLLQGSTEKRLRNQLLEVTSMRDYVAHPKLYLVKQLWKSDDNVIEQSPKLATGVEHRKKTESRKQKRFERTASLRLPLVTTWISYVDMVLCVLVITRFVNLLQEKCDYRGSLGSFSVRNDPTGFFHDWGSTTRKSILLEEWVQAFFNSLSPADQQLVQKRLGTKPSKYIQKRISSALIPEFLRKPPPWKMHP